MSRDPRIEPWDEHNRALVSHVHPGDWRDPEPADRYHLVVLGAGTGGLVTAAIAAGLGAKVALVEKHLMGGDCLNVGCVPSKGMIAAGRAWHTARTAAERFGGPRMSGEGDFSAAMERMRRLRAKIAPIDGAARFRDELGIDVFLGHGRFVASDTLEVDGARLRFRRAVVATGGRASMPPIPGLSAVGALTNETVFSLTERPRRFGVIGAGPIGCELAQAFARLGSEVVLVDRGRQILHREDTDAAAIVEASMVGDGVEIVLDAKVHGVEPTEGGGATLCVGKGPGHREIATPTVDALLVAAGRAPNVDDLGLEAAGVEFDPKTGVSVDARLRTTNPKIYAVGDVASRYPFTHAADAQARMVVRNALFFGRGASNDLVIPWSTYTSPEIAHVGRWASEEGSDSGDEVDTITVPFDEVDRAILDGETEGFLRVHLEKGKDRILGATAVGPDAGELIGALSFAMTHGLGLAKFSSTVFPYPTRSEVLRKAGDRYNRGRLTDTARKFFEIWFKIFS